MHFRRLWREEYAAWKQQRYEARAAHKRPAYPTQSTESSFAGAGQRGYANLMEQEVEEITEVEVAEVGGVEVELEAQIEDGTVLVDRLRDLELDKYVEIYVIIIFC